MFFTSMSKKTITEYSKQYTQVNINNIEIITIISLLYLPKNTLSCYLLDNTIREVMLFFFNFVIVGLVEIFHKQTFFLK